MLSAGAVALLAALTAAAPAAAAPASASTSTPAPTAAVTSTPTAEPSGAPASSPSSTTATPSGSGTASAGPSASSSSSPSATAFTPKTAAGVTGVLYAVLPHPDDEFQVWSQVERTPDLFKVFVLLTHGEESSNCDPELPGYDRGAEPAPEPLPQGRWTASCEQARLDSWRGFFSDMAATDASVPASFTDRGEVSRLVAGRSTPVCRVDAAPGTCASRNRSARVWTDDGGRGALVVFDLGDRDLTRDEAVWAVESVRDNRSRLGIDPSLPSRGVVGSYYDEVSASGFRYPHPDHRAVAEALASTDLRLGPQLGATAADDPRVRVTAAVSDQATGTAFGWGSCSGAHARWYGWLWHSDLDPNTGAPEQCFQVDRGGQRRLFSRMQYFWEDFAPSASSTSSAEVAR
ncbi:hypothetical protein FHN55_06150 [Streptomyces sp. NP160]|uniref:hypothetical protein n=1 Tax=Streptomyces sp. NP160 TaxID=2586637 RepID=UPI0011198090|nr:hypothetical protein [Streptomyces sp. NP160]TNM68784.1 hypothetical protein FHN55_06150 [Streptomyces sp. NP160]